jgi:hypothetical protein
MLQFYSMYFAACQLRRFFFENLYPLMGIWGCYPREIFENLYAKLCLLASRPKELSLESLAFFKIELKIR